MSLAAAIFVVMLELTLVSEGWPLRRLNRFAGGVAALAASWAIAIPVYELLVASDGPVAGLQFGAALVCIGVAQAAFYVVLGGWPFSLLRSQAMRLGSANVTLIVGGVLVYLALARAGGAQPPDHKRSGRSSRRGGPRHRHAVRGVARLGRRGSGGPRDNHGDSLRGLEYVPPTPSAGNAPSPRSSSRTPASTRSVPV